MGIFKSLLSPLLCEGEHTLLRDAAPGVSYCHTGESLANLQKALHRLSPALALVVSLVSVLSGLGVQLGTSPLPAGTSHPA